MKTKNRILQPHRPETTSKSRESLNDCTPYVRPSTTPDTVAFQMMKPGDGIAYSLRIDTDVELRVALGRSEASHRFAVPAGKTTLNFRDADPDWFLYKDETEYPVEFTGEGTEYYDEAAAKDPILVPDEGNDMSRLLLRVVLPVRGRRLSLFVWVPA